MIAWRLASNVAAGPKSHSRQHRGKAVVLHEGLSVPTREGCCFSRPNNVMARLGREVLPAWGCAEHLSLRVIRD